MQHKSACLLHALSLESGTEGDLKKLLGRVAGFCTDMGTELGIAEAVYAPISESPALGALPLGGAGDAVTEDSGFAPIGDIGMDPAVADDTLPTPGEHLYEHAIPVPGICHIIDDCSGAIHKDALAHWSAF